jgi:hypothetical protein
MYYFSLNDRRLKGSLSSPIQLLVTSMSGPRCDENADLIPEAHTKEWEVAYPELIQVRHP